ncbi:hypothetical protein DY000_02056004 [Brassica cretica]|uniref:Uncharacterized protein n=1 Tax=Brassica cretica TaxID=69181 RepID=A0ABQ7ADQ7_BRACR|nr:hypothetical protein DY000_02056004 [Brassica cretica]
MMLRKRADEGGVSLKYLHDMHEKHESWLLPFESGNHRVLSFSKLSLQMDNSLHPDIKDLAYFFEFVKKKQETSQERQTPLLMPPHNGGLWMGPEGKHVPGLELPSLDFRKAMSLLTRLRETLPHCFVCSEGALSGLSSNVNRLRYQEVYNVCDWISDFRPDVRNERNGSSGKQSCSGGRARSYSGWMQRKRRGGARSCGSGGEEVAVAAVKELQQWRCPELEQRP